MLQSESLHPHGQYRWFVTTQSKSDLLVSFIVTKILCVLYEILPSWISEICIYLYLDIRIYTYLPHRFLGMKYHHTCFNVGQFISMRRTSQMILRVACYIKNCIISVAFYEHKAITRTHERRHKNASTGYPQRRERPDQNRCREDGIHDVCSGAKPSTLEHHSQCRYCHIRVS